MRDSLARIRRGERLWPIEIGARLLGLALLVLSLRLSLALQRHLAGGVTPGQFAAGLAAFALLVCGLAALVEGPGLWRLLPVPGLRKRLRTDQRGLDSEGVSRADRKA